MQQCCLLGVSCCSRTTEARRLSAIGPGRGVNSGAHVTGVAEKTKSLPPKMEDVRFFFDARGRETHPRATP